MTRTHQQDSPPAPAGYRAAVNRLRAGASKSNKGAAGYTRWVNRPVGRHIAALAYGRGLTPNQLTLISGAGTIGGIVIIGATRPTWIVDVGAVLLMLVAYTFDSADGQLARLRGGGSLAGEYLDHCFDAIKTSIVHLAVLVVWFRYYDVSRPVLLIPLAFAAIHPIFFFSLMLSDNLKARLAPPPGPAAPAPAEGGGYLQSFVVLPNDWGVVCLCLALLPAVTAFITVYTVLLAANTIFLLAGLVRWYRRLLSA